MITHPKYNNLLLFKNLEKFSEIAHFSTTRKGGVCEGEYKSFNLGNYSDDDPIKIYENRTALARKFFLQHKDLITPHQVHGSEIFVVDSDFLQLEKGERLEKIYGYDASITNERGFFICVTTADCVPILLYDTKQQAIAAIHAGWRGTSERIVEKTILKMQTQYNTKPENIVAAIGPSINIKHYEVGNDVEYKLLNNGFSLVARNSYRHGTTKKLHIDLKEINRQELLRLGVPLGNIEKARYCTFSNENLFFSARRQSVHSGRMLTGIMLKDNVSDFQ